MRVQALLPAAALVLLTACGGGGARPAEPPPILWLWEREEDLSFLELGEAGAAILVAEIWLHGDKVTVRGRHQPVGFPPGLYAIPVVRFEAEDAALSESQRSRLVDELARLAESRTRPVLQIDFDATRSQRDFYRRLLEELAARLGPDAEISITALASWCLDDRWLADLPIAEAVPMLFDMGAEGPAILDRLAAGGDFTEPLCRRSYGLATYHPWPPLQPGRQLYLFHDSRWTRSALKSLF